VAALSPATPDKVQEKFSMMNGNLVRIVRNWERSGQGDGGIDVENDGDEDGDFGQLSNHSHGALHTRSGFLGTNQPYLLYLWEMLNKYQLLCTAFTELDNDDEDNSFYCGSGYCSDTGSSLIVTSRKGKSSSKKKSRLTTPSRDFSSRLDRLAQSNIVASKIDVSSSLLEAEYRTLDMALVDDPHPKKKTKIEEQMSTVESKI